MAVEHTKPSATQKPAVAQPSTTAPPTQRASSPSTLPRPRAVLQRAQTDPSSLTPTEANVLQRALGLRATQRMLAGQAGMVTQPPLGGMIQAKLTVGAADDRYEREAERLAAQVMSMPSATAHGESQHDHGSDLHRSSSEPANIAPIAESNAVQMSSAAHQPGCGCPGCSGQTVQRSADIGAHSPGCSCPACTGQLQRSPSAEAHTAGCACAACNGPAIQRHSLIDEIHQVPDLQKHASMRGSFDAGKDFESRLAKRRGSSLPSEVRRFMEPRFGADFSSVRVHAGKEAASLSRQIRADAFTHGRDIFMGAGKYQPDTAGGKRLLAHELTHVVQQNGSKVLAKRSQRVPAGPSSLQRLATAPAYVQRHSSWEHKALGDINPDRLAILGTYQEMQEANKTAKKQAGWFKKPDPNDVKVQVGDPLNRDLTLSDFLHVITQEIDRLKTFRDHPPKEANARAEQELVDRSHIREARKELEGEFGKRQFRQKTREDYQLAFQNKLDELRQAQDQWQVRLLAIEHRDPKTGAPTGEKTIITYGEMNTLGDFVGDPGQLERIPQDNLQKIINGIRQQAMIRFMRMRDQVKGKNTENKNYWGQGFSKTAGSTGRGPLIGDTGIGSEKLGKLGSEGMGQLRLMLADKSVVKGEKETAYDAGLARNACHFAPESWITWEKYHREAIDLAQRSVMVRHAATQQGLIPAQVKAQLAHADDLKSKALVRNGFADHFLQDSYAAGHLINKDEIMKWYQMWLANDSQWNNWITTHKGAVNAGGAETDPSYAGGTDVTQEHGIGAWRRWDYMKNRTSQKQTALVKTQTGLGVDANRYNINNVGPGQLGKNMQAVENMGGTWQERFSALGLQLPTSLKVGNRTNWVLKRWQRLVGETGKFAEITPTEFYAQLNNPGLDQPTVTNAFAQFATDGVAIPAGKRWFGAGKGETIYELRKQYRLTDARSRLDKVRGRPKQLTDVGGGDYEERAKKGVYKDYHTYMNNAALQASTNILHDHFCEKGLFVNAANGHHIGKVYGDDAMFKRESAKGVAYAGETSNLSRDAIYEILNSPPAAVAPPEPLGKETNTIKQRFPTQVTMANGGGAMSLADWHERGPLKLMCEKTIFPAANRNMFKTFIGGGKAAATTGLTKKISKDVSVHQGAIF